MAVSDEIAANSAYKVRHVEDYPSKNPTYNKMPRRRTPLSSHMRIPRVQLLSLALLPSDSCTRFSAPTLLYSGPMTAFAGIFVQPLTERNFFIIHLRLWVAPAALQAPGGYRVPDYRLCDSAAAAVNDGAADKVQGDQFKERSDRMPHDACATPGYAACGETLTEGLRRG